ncbi:hypothetical protein BN1723_012184 [Verticillium longisporum]|uniref:Uncharacterized protein n=1 Tax=Verticillium longisporum TaxID=100787 RepID=A0A0G4LFR5_VERLO|nr:hypothetical protein BN1723_012184 [Verticillium longisporum]
MRVVLFGMTSCSGPLLTDPNATDQLAREATDDAGFDPRLAGEADAKRRLRGAALEGSAACADRGGSVAGGRGKLQACRLKTSMLRELGRRGFGEYLVHKNVSVDIQWFSELLDLRAWAARPDYAVGGCDGSDFRRWCAGARSRCGRIWTGYGPISGSRTAAIVFCSDGRAITQPDGFLNELELMSYDNAACTQ